MRLATEEDAVEFEAYARQSRLSLLRFAVVLTDDPERAQDVVQDVLLRAQQRWAHIGGLEHPHAYVRRMVANEVVSWHRKWGRVEARPLHELDAPLNDPTDAVERRDTILRQLARLPVKQRAAVVMRFFEDMTDVEIAEVLGCRPVTVRGHVHRALKTMRIDLATRTALELHS